MRDTSTLMVAQYFKRKRETVEVIMILGHIFKVVVVVVKVTILIIAHPLIFIIIDVIAITPIS